MGIYFINILDYGTDTMIEEFEKMMSYIMNFTVLRLKQFVSHIST